MPRITDQTERVFRALLAADLLQGLYGFEIGKQAGLPSGTVHPILARWERAGILDSYWEDPATHEDLMRPRRRYYRFTPDGAQYVRVALAALDQGRRAESRSGIGIATPDVAPGVG